MSNPNPLNLSAAKCLGWPENTELARHYYYDIPKEFHSALSNSNIILDSPVAIRQMKFTESMDWCMLLVKECDKRGLKFELDDVFRELFGEWFDCPVDLLLLRPEQITKACVQVLEETQGNDV